MQGVFAEINLVAIVRIHWMRERVESRNLVIKLDLAAVKIWMKEQMQALRIHEVPSMIVFILSPEVHSMQ